MTCNIVFLSFFCKTVDKNRCMIIISIGSTSIPSPGSLSYKGAQKCWFMSTLQLSGWREAPALWGCSFHTSWDKYIIRQICNSDKKTFLRHFVAFFVEREPALHCGVWLPHTVVTIHSTQNTISQLSRYLPYLWHFATLTVGVWLPHTVVTTHSTQNPLSQLSRKGSCAECTVGV